MLRGSKFITRSNDTGKIEALKDEMEEAEAYCFDPIVVCRDYLIDGVHRFSAAKEAGYLGDAINSAVELEDIFSEAGFEWDEECQEDYDQDDMVALVNRLPSYIRDRHGIELHWG